jgi:hypothetical protein
MDANDKINDGSTREREKESHAFEERNFDDRNFRTSALVYVTILAFRLNSRFEVPQMPLSVSSRHCDSTKVAWKKLLVILFDTTLSLSSRDNECCLEHTVIRHKQISRLFADKEYMLYSFIQITSLMLKVQFKIRLLGSKLSERMRIALDSESLERKHFCSGHFAWMTMKSASRITKAKWRIKEEWIMSHSQ